MSDADTASGSVPPNGSQKDRHEPRGRKPNDHLPPSRAREVQRAFRLRRAEHLASLEERIAGLESENSQLRALLSIPEADRPKIGSGPTGRGKALREGGVPMSERVRARKEARERERRAKGLPEPESSDLSDHERDSQTLSPRAVGGGGGGGGGGSLAGGSSHRPSHDLSSSMFGSNPDQSGSNSFNYNMSSMPFHLPVSPESSFPDFTSGGIDSSSLFKNSPHSSGFNSMFSMFDQPAPEDMHRAQHGGPLNRRSPLSPPLSAQGGSSNVPGQPDLLTRLKSCCHLSDSHVVNDPGLLIFATRLCQSFPCNFSGVHPESTNSSDGEHLLLEDSWKALKMQLDPGGEADGENRINTGRMAAELVCRAAASRGPGSWIVCRYREGMSIKRSMIAQLIQGFGGRLD